MVLRQLHGVSPKEFISAWHGETRMTWFEGENKEAATAYFTCIQEQPRQLTHRQHAHRLDSSHTGDTWDMCQSNSRWEFPCIRVQSGEQNPLYGFLRERTAWKEEIKWVLRDWKSKNETLNHLNISNLKKKEWPPLKPYKWENKRKEVRLLHLGGWRRPSSSPQLLLKLGGGTSDGIERC